MAVMFAFKTKYIYYNNGNFSVIVYYAFRNKGKI